MDQTVPCQLSEKAVQSGLYLQIQAWGRAPKRGEDSSGILRGTKILHVLFERGNDCSIDHQHRIAVTLKIRPHRVADVIEDAHNPDHRGGINSLTTGLVIQRNV